MSSGAEQHLLDRIANAAIEPSPYPYIYVPEVFPADFYRELRRHLPPASAYRTLRALKRVTKDYPETRLVLPLTAEAIGALDQPYRDFWRRTRKWLLDGRLLDLALSRFAPFLQQRFGRSKVEYFHEALVVQDQTDYSLGPHTDSVQKVLSFLFYLPADDRHAQLGTSMYAPKVPGFTCPGGPHYSFERFEKLRTLPYLPNSLFAFLKTDHSFHGVEPIEEPNVHRDLLLYDIRMRTNVKFSM
jgi:hypothetical protein